MKRIVVFLAAALLAAPVVSHAQDAATEERLKNLSAQIEVLIEIKDAQNKRIEELSRQVRELEQQLHRPNASYASQEDVKRLADAVKDIDQKRVQDNELILKAIENIRKSVAAGGTRRPPVVNTSGGTSAGRTEKGYEYEIKSGDSYSIIAKAYRDQGIKVTAEQIQKANEGVNPNSLKVGQKIWIPAP